MAGSLHFIARIGDQGVWASDSPDEALTMLRRLMSALNKPTGSSPLSGKVVFDAPHGEEMVAELILHYPPKMG